MPAKKTRRRSRRNRPRVECAVCHRAFARIDVRHLRTHNLDLETYRRTFPNAPLAPNTTPPAFSPGQEAGAISRPASLAVAEALVTDPEFVGRMADSVAQTIFGSSLRNQLRLALCSTLSARMEIHAKAVAHLQAVREELAQPWRIKDGGKDGGPTPTPHLVGMAGEAHHEVTKTEEALLRAIRLASEEQRHTTAETNLHGRPAFTGEAEVIPVPPSLSPGERETVRSLLGLLRKEMAARATQRGDTGQTPAITVDGTPTDTDAPRAGCCRA